MFNATGKGNKRYFRVVLFGFQKELWRNGGQNVGSDAVTPGAAEDESALPTRTDGFEKVILGKRIMSRPVYWPAEFHSPTQRNYKGQY